MASIEDIIACIGSVESEAVAAQGAPLIPFPLAGNMRDNKRCWNIPDDPGQSGGGTGSFESFLI